MNFLTTTNDSQCTIDLFDQLVCLAERCIKARLILGVPVRTALVVVIIRKSLLPGRTFGKPDLPDSRGDGLDRGGGGVIKGLFGEKMSFWLTGAKYAKTRYF